MQRCAGFRRNPQHFPDCHSLPIAITSVRSNRTEAIWRRRTLARTDPERSGGAGTSDTNNGGGAASGTPDAEVGTQTDATNLGNPKDDRKKLFPDSTGEASKAGQRDVSNEETE